jgi:uncharacterized protein
MSLFDHLPPRPRLAVESPVGSARSPRASTAPRSVSSRVPWTFGQTILGTVLTLAPILALTIGSQLLAGPNGASVPAKPLTLAQDTAGAVFVIVSPLIVEGVLLIAPFLIAVLRPAPGYTPLDGLRALGFRAVKIGALIGWLIVGLALAVAASAAYSVLIQHFHLHVQTNGDLLTQEAKYAPRTILATVAGAVVIAPICEETFFRGFVQGGLRRGLGAVLALIITALVFGLAHGDIGSFALLAALGLVLGIARLSSGSLWPGFLIHTANNALAAAAVLPLVWPLVQHR